MPCAIHLATILLPGMLAATAAVARGDCPPAVLDEARAEAILEEVRQAPDEQSGQRIANELWEVWADAPDVHAQELLDNGIARRAAFDLEGALVAFEALVAYCPGYAEGYNQRAFVRFIQQDFVPALEDLDEALARNPEHLGALSGRAMTYLAMGRDAEALQDLEAAVAINPWLKERAFLPMLRERLGDRDL